MRAWQVDTAGEPADVLRIVGRDRPFPAEGQVRLRVAAAAVGLPDVLMCRGSYPLTPTLPFTPGQEAVGVVTAVGGGVDPALIGRRVLGATLFTSGWGGFGTETLAAARNLYPAPEAMADADAAAFFVPYHTAWTALVRRARLAEGETVLVLGGAGGSGAAAIQVAAAMGATVIGVAGSAAKAEFCRRMGAEAVIDHSAGEIGPEVLEITGGSGADVVFDPVGGVLAGSALGAVANEARFLLVGYASGSWAPLHEPDLVRRNYSAVGVFTGAYDRGFSESTHDALLGLWEAGRLPSLVTEVFDFESLPDACTQLADRVAIGRVVLRIN